IKDFTGIDSPYEPPQNPDLRLTTDRTLEELAQQIIELVSAQQSR
ncbi:MAG: adenylyl-sulfate kinase, partial [Mycobacteriaceae bacterium]|nr:adenylyl-sulfate kinase [Mycobacteriaceae bacterium]